jgi:hypothetical protein
MKTTKIKKECLKMPLLLIAIMCFLISVSSGCESNATKKNAQQSEYKSLKSKRILDFASGFAEEFIKSELSSNYVENSSTYYISHLTGDINSDGKSDLLIKYGIDGKKEGALIGLGWSIIFSDDEGFANNYLIFDWEEGSCGPNVSGLGHPNKIENGNITAEQPLYNDDDPCCCPSISSEQSYKFENGHLVSPFNENNVINPSKLTLR